jgi:hypothetical protein
MGQALVAPDASSGPQPAGESQSPSIDSNPAQGAVEHARGIPVRGHPSSARSSFFPMQ